MKILLTHGYFLAEDEKEQHIMKPYMPLGILYISAFLEQHGFANEVFDTTFSGKNEFYRYLGENKPDVIGIYTNLMTKLNVLKIVSHIRENLPETIIVLGGPEVRASAENFLRHGADITVIGEGEETMLELVRHFEKEKAVAGLTNVPGIAFLQAGVFIQTPEREKIKDLGILPFPNRHKVNLHAYLDTWKNFHGKSAVSVSTMRGCPYSCKWCSRAVYGMSYRRRPAALVAEELQQVYRDYQPDSIWFVDDVFTINHRWLNEFRIALDHIGLKISYECITRADRLDEQAIRVLKDTGCFRVWIGAESGSQKVIDLMDRRVQVQQVREMIKLASANGIETGTFIMLGYPGETEADIRETVRHLKSSNPDHFTITVAYPIRGTALYKQIESLKTVNLEWHQSTDRDIDFKRAYSRKYYNHAVRYVVTEVNAYKLFKQSKYLGSMKQKLFSFRARLGMEFRKLINS